MKKTWKEAKLTSFIKRNSGLYAEYKKAVENGCDDDRRVFVNTFDMIVNAIASLPDEPVAYIRVAMWRQINHDQDTLDRIAANFCD